MDGCVAVFDLGKTNIKLVIFDRPGNVLAERSKPNAPLPPDARWPYLRLDADLAWRFLLDSLKHLGAQFPIEAVSIATHGAAGVLIGEDDFALPPMDYEFDGFAPVDGDYNAVRPPFEESFSPNLTRGLNLARQIFYLKRVFPQDFDRVRGFLCYPQYWAWRLGGEPASEVTSLGAHTDLWRPMEGRLSSMVERLGWTWLFPPLRRAWETLGTLMPELAAQTGLSPQVRIICGAHDSNASLVPHLAARTEPFTVVSTGTWVIMMAVGGKGKLDPKADMLANVDVRGDPVPTARLMGGREFAALAGEAPAEIREADVEAVVEAGVMAMPAFSDQGGPFAGRKGWIVGLKPATQVGRTALATVYSALMTSHMLDRLEAPGDIIVEGGFNRSPAFAGLLAALMPGRNIVTAPTSGAAAGAARLARWGERREPPALSPVKAWNIARLLEYRDRWEARVQDAAA